MDLDANDTPAPCGSSAAPESLPSDRLHVNSVTVQAAQVTVTVDVPPGSSVRVEIEARRPSGDVFARQMLRADADGLHVEPSTGASEVLAKRAALPWGQWRARAQAWLSAPSLWMGAALLIYGLVRLIGLARFPIYFFTDEAVQTMLAADFLRDHLHNYANDFLPTFFENGSQYNLGLSVYLQVLPTLFFGKSILVTRGTAALVTLVAALSVGLTYKKYFDSRFPWLAVLILSITPAWFLHSRTAFETSLAVTFYAAFLYFYLRYRCENPTYLYAAVGMAALVFYSYSPARLVMLVTAVLLLVSDFRYHRQHPRQVLRGLGLALLLTLPLVRFVWMHPTEFGWQMRLLGSYWLSDIPLIEKLGLYGREYLKGLDPLYWYLPQSDDLARHILPGHGHLLKYTLPFGMLGLGIVAANLKKPAYRALLITILAAPAGAAMVAMGITRVLIMVIPMAIVTALGAEWLMRRVTLRWPWSRGWVAGLVFAVLALGNLAMLGDALRNGPTWEQNYTLNGMQWGARQLFGSVREYLSTHPDVDLRVSPSWGNGTDVLARFFFDDPLPFQMGNADSYYHQVKDLPNNTVFVLIPEEFAAIPREKFAQVQVEQVLAYPNGQPGFYFVRLQYVDNIGQVMAAEEEQHRQLVEAQIVLDGQTVLVRHSRLDIGEIGMLFDNDDSDLVRSDSINPLEIWLEFPAPRRTNAVELVVGGEPTHVKLMAYPPGESEPLVVETTLDEQPLPRRVVMELEGEHDLSAIRLEIRNLNDAPDGHVHLWLVLLR